MCPDLDDPIEPFDDDGGESELLDCPSCGHTVYEESDKCPYCGEWIMPLAAARPAWFRFVAAIIALGLLCGLATGLIRLFL